MANAAAKSGNIGVPFAAIVTTDATTGQATVTFPAGRFTAPPVVATGVVNASGDGRDILVTIVGLPTAAGCTVLARKTRTLPASILALSALQGFDLFVPVAAQVEILARAAT